MLGPGNEEAAREALAEWPDALQLGGGITESNAQQWLDLGAGKVRGSTSFQYLIESSVSVTFID